MAWSPAMQASIGMKWLRSNIKHGARLALFALALQFALSFGHFHEGAARAAPAVQSGSANSLAPPLLLLPQAIEILYLSTDAEFAHLNSARVAFQPRAPPIS